MKNDYSWVAEKKQEAMRQKLQQRGMPRYAQRPVSERFGVSYTGLGEDGRLDRSAPAGIDMYPSPHVFHEGETRIATPEGRAYLSADVTQGAGLSDMAQQGAIPGFATGGGIMARAAGYTGARDAPQYTPAPAPRVGGNPYMANLVPGNNQPAQQNNQGAQQYQPRVQGWNVSPAAMGNYGAAMLARQPQAQPAPAPTPQQPPVPIPQQQPNAPAPRVGSNPYMADIMGGRMPAPIQGFAAGGATVETIGENGQGSTPNAGTGSSSNSGAGSTPVVNTSGNASAAGSGSGINVAGGAQETLAKSNGGTSSLSKAQPSQIGYTNDVNVSAGGSDNIVPISAPQATAPKQDVATKTINIAPVSAPQGTVNNPSPVSPVVNAPPAYLSSELPAQPNVPTSVQFLRGAEGQWRVDDMKREAASQQAYQDFQQAMRGTDANAAWAQDQMLRAQQEEGINNFAAQYAQGQDERNWNKLMDILTDPNSSQSAIAAAGAGLNKYFAGTGIDLSSGYMDAAKSRDFYDGMGEIELALTDGADWNTFFASGRVPDIAKKMGIPETEVWNIFNNKQNVDTTDWVRSLEKDPRWSSLSPEDQNFLKTSFAEGTVLGDMLERVTYRVVGADGNVIKQGIGTFLDAQNIAYRNKGQLLIDDVNLVAAGDFDSVEKTQYTPGATNPWTSEAAATILEKGDTTSQEYKEVISDMAKYIKDGVDGYSPVALIQLDETTRNAVLAQLTVTGLVSTDGSGENKKNKKGYHYYPNWNKAMDAEPPQIVMIEGRPAIITNREQGNTNLNKWTRYHITYLDGDEKTTKRASSNTKAFSGWGALAGGIVGSIIPVVGTAAGAAIGSQIGKGANADSVSAAGQAKPTEYKTEEGGG